MNDSVPEVNKFSFIAYRNCCSRGNPEKFYVKNKVELKDKGVGMVSILAGTEIINIEADGLSNENLVEANIGKLLRKPDATIYFQVSHHV